MNRRRIIRIGLRVLLFLCVLVLLALAILGFGVDYYINQEKHRDLSKYLPINGSCSYARASFHPFKDLPNLTLKLHDVVLQDSLINEHERTPLTLDELSVHVSIADWKKKTIAVEDILLKGLDLQVYTREDGYSNLSNILIPSSGKKKRKTKSSPSVLIDHSNVQLSDIAISKIDEQTKQQAHIFLENGEIVNRVNNDVNDISVQLSNVSVSDHDDDKSNRPIFFESLNGALALSKDFGSAQMKQLSLQDGHIHLIADATGKTVLNAITGNKKANREDKSKKPLSIIVDSAQIKLSDIAFLQVDTSKHKHLEATVNALRTTVITSPDTSLASTVDISIAQLGFNTEKGAYLESSRVKGDVTVNYQDKRIDILSHTLDINGDNFDIQANLFLDKKTPSTLDIKKKDASTVAIRPLLTKKIQASISKYDVAQPFDAKATITFIPGKKDPRAEVKLNIINNTITVQGQQLNQASARVTFVNRLYDDKRQMNEGRRNARVIIHHVNGLYNDFNIKAENGLVTSTPSGGDQIKLNTIITGNAASASKFLKHDNFYFENGEFSVLASLDGSLNKLDDLIEKTDVSLNMEDLKVMYPKSEAEFPFRLLTLDKKGEKTLFHIAGKTFDNNKEFHIRGEIDQVESLIFPGLRQRTSTVAKIRANTISWEGIVALFGEHGVFSDRKKERKAKRSMKQTLTGIQETFQPVIDIVIDTVIYRDDIQLVNFITGARFKDRNTIILEKTNFLIDDSRVNLDGQVKINALDFTKFDFDIHLHHMNFDNLLPKFDYFNVKLLRQVQSQPEDISMNISLKGELDDTDGLKPETIDSYITYNGHGTEGFSGSLALKAKPEQKLIDVNFSHVGHPKNINYLLGSEEYVFDKGQYEVSFHFNDNLDSLPQMVEESEVSFSMSNAEVYIKEMDHAIPLTDINLQSKDNDATYSLFLRSDALDQQVMLAGNITNVRHFLFSDTDQPYDVDLTISSPRLVWQDMVTAFQATQSGSAQKTHGKVMKESLSKVLHDFNPRVTLDIKKLEYSDKFTFQDVFGKAFLEGNTLQIHDANVAYGDSRVQVAAQAVLDQDEILPFDLNVQLTNINIGDVLEHHQYFDNDQLREADTLNGNVWLDLNLSSEINLENNGFNTEKTKAHMGIHLEDLVIAGLPTIDTIARKIGWEKRLQDIRFAPISTSININGSRLEIPLTEIQSNALHVFVQGTLDKSSSENLWISVPLSNLKKPDLETIPEPTGYAAAGKKIYLQMISSHDEDHGKMKVHLKKKKYYQERFMVREYRSYKREMRAARKEERQLKRKRKKENKDSEK